GMLDGADSKIAAALAAPAEGSAGGQASYDAKVEAENRIYAIQKVARVAGENGAEKDVGDALKSLAQQAEQRGAALIADIKAGKLNAQGREAAKQQVYGAVRLLELVGGANAASRLMRDGLAAVEKMPGSAPARSLTGGDRPCAVGGRLGVEALQILVEQPEIERVHVGPLHRDADIECLVRIAVLVADAVHADAPASWP